MRTILIYNVLTLDNIPAICTQQIFLNEFLLVIVMIKRSSAAAAIIYFSTVNPASVSNNHKSTIFRLASYNPQADTLFIPHNGYI